MHPGGAMKFHLFLMEKAQSMKYNYITKANGKTLLTAELASQYGFKEDYDTDGSINNARLEATKFFKETMNKPLTQYNLEASVIQTMKVSLIFSRFSIKMHFIYHLNI